MRDRRPGGTVVAKNAATGQVVWNHDNTYNLTSTPAVANGLADGVLYVNAGNLYAFGL